MSAASDTNSLKQELHTCALDGYEMIMTNATLILLTNAALILLLIIMYHLALPDQARGMIAEAIKKYL